MPIPEQNYFMSRVPKIDEDVSAIRTVQEQHGHRLITIEGKVGRLQKTADQHSAQLTLLQTTVDQHSAILAEHGQKLDVLGQDMVGVKATLGEILRRLPASA